MGDAVRRQPGAVAGNAVLPCRPAFDRVPAPYGRFHDDHGGPAARFQEGAMQRKANAEWKGGLKDGTGRLSSTSGALRDTAYDFHSRFEQGAATNPEELIAAAHAGCFSMALSGILGEAGLTPESIQTEATVHLEKQDAGWTLARIDLDVLGRVPGATAESFREAAEKAKAGCPVSRVLKADIHMNARLA
jgi:osmotically inducible protein OsmC